MGNTLKQYSARGNIPRELIPPEFRYFSLVEYSDGKRAHLSLQDRCPAEIMPPEARRCARFRPEVGHSVVKHQESGPRPPMLSSGAARSFGSLVFAEIRERESAPASLTVRPAGDRIDATRGHADGVRVAAKQVM